MFTKEELEDIANALWAYDTPNDTSFYNELLEKVNNLIDSYYEQLTLLELKKLQLVSENTLEKYNDGILENIVIKLNKMISKD